MATAETTAKRQPLTRELLKTMGDAEFEERHDEIAAWVQRGGTEPNRPAGKA